MAAAEYTKIVATHSRDGSTRKYIVRCLPGDCGSPPGTVGVYPDATDAMRAAAAHEDQHQDGAGGEA
jgi:hypothetical protein